VVRLPSSTVKLLHAAKYDDIVADWKKVEEAHSEDLPAIRAELGRVDRYYLLVVILHRYDARNEWLYTRCREVEAEPDGCLDLWAREHYKSTIITFAGAIQEILNNPEITIGIFSHGKAVAKKFLWQIKSELEANAELQSLYQDILWSDPRKQAPTWSLDDGIVVKRKSNPKEKTIEAHGLVDGMPTGSHFLLMIYDDVVVPESVTTPEQIQKTTEAWSLSDNLGARNENGLIRKQHVGTRYKFGDTYSVIMELKVLKPRIYPATKDGTKDGEPVFLSQQAWDEKKKSQIPSILAAQQLLNPSAGLEAMFQKAWLKFTDIRPKTLNVYIMGDPAGSKKKSSDKTAIMAIGIDAARNKYLLDGYHHKMNLAERWTALKNLRRHWVNQPGIQIVNVGWERYGLQADAEYFEIEMQRDGGKEAFSITELAWPSEGPGPKFDRIQRLVPDFMQGKFFLTALTEEGKETTNQRKCRENGEAFRILKPVKRRDHEGNIYSLNKNFLEQFLVYPFIAHEDALDAASRVYDMDPQPPVIIDERALEPEAFVDGI
jgi:phage terminase large subunit-like protein